MTKTVGDFQITEKIGKGSFAEVYLGISLTDNKRYAVKVTVHSLHRHGSFDRNTLR